MSKHISVDIGFNDDPTCYCYTKTPSKFRLWLRKWLLRWETWEVKVVRFEFAPPTKKPAERG